MTRPRLWTEEQVLASAIDVFHSKGYERASLRDLERATGLHTGSLYQAYGSKAGLFEAVLGAYNERVVAARIARHLESAADPVEGLTAFFASTYEGRPQPDPGCMITNGAIESPHLSAEARAMVAAGLGSIRGALLDLLLRGGGETSDQETARAEGVADQLLALYQGLLVLIRFGHPRPALESVTAAIPSLLSAPGAASR